jgi:hypothetical protein
MVVGKNFHLKKSNHNNAEKRVLDAFQASKISKMDKTDHLFPPSSPDPLEESQFSTLKKRHMDPNSVPTLETFDIEISHEKSIQKKVKLFDTIQVQIMEAKSLLESTLEELTEKHAKDSVTAAIINLKNALEGKAETFMESRVTAMENKLDNLVNILQSSGKFKNEGKVSYANVASKQKTSAPPTRIQSQPQPKTIAITERRIILKPKDNWNHKSLKPMEMRNLINFKLNQQKCNALIATVTLSLKKNLILTVLENQTAKAAFMLKDHWLPELEKYIPVESIGLSNSWHKVVLHNVPTDCFGGTEAAMQELKDEIEVFNPKLKLATLPRWLILEEKRAGKQQSSVVIAFQTAQEARIALKGRILIAGVAARTTKYEPRTYISSKQATKEAATHMETTEDEIEI